MFFLKKSIIARIGASMLAISLMALVSMMGSVIVAHNTHGDAAGISLAGSLRLLSYKMVSQMGQYQSTPNHQNRLLVTRSIAEFEHGLFSPALAQVIPKDGDQAMYDHYQSIIWQWQQNIKPALEASAQHHPKIDFIAFVSDIDTVVLMLVKSTESKIKLLSLVQGVSLFMTVLIMLVAMLDIKNYVIRPLKLLVSAAQQTGQGNFHGRVDYDSDDELGLLSKTFNQMAAELSKIYLNLEHRIESKTSELQQSNEALQLLYDASRSLNQKQDLCHRIMPVMKQLETVTPFGPIDVTLLDHTDPNNQRIYASQCDERPSHCREQDCGQCLVSNIDRDRRLTLALPIKTEDHYFGEFNAQYQSQSPPTATEIKLVETLVESLATSMALDLKADQDQHMSLIEERSVIARELHDSLAQALSYLKIQVARLQILRRTSANEGQIDEVVGELKSGLNNAYLQLRELLTTFRLQLDAPGLEPALSTTVQEFSGRLGYDIDYQCNLQHQRLTPNEEIHVLQLVREALSNVVKHAFASQVRLSVVNDHGHVEVCISDNGVGLTNEQNNNTHHGLTIMQDRTDILGGTLAITSPQAGGTLAKLRFSSKHHA